jgi:hypothetical protein
MALSKTSSQHGGSYGLRKGAAVNQKNTSTTCRAFKEFAQPKRLVMASVQVRNRGRLLDSPPLVVLGTFNY